MSELEIIEAALFAAGRAVSLEKLMKITGMPKKNVSLVVRELMEAYSSRGSGIEILDLGERYVMQVKPEYSELMREVAPKELSAPKLRTLSMVAYHQPLLQSNLIEMRGSGAYDHIKDLIERGFVDSVPCGRSRQLSTTPLFADYFGLKRNDPNAIKEKIIELLKAQGGQSEIDLWIGKKIIAVTPMYESLMKMCGIKDYFVANAYCPSKEEISRLLEADVLVVTAGYLDAVKQHCDGEILEVRSTTFDDLIEAVSLLAEELPDEVNPKTVEKTLQKIRETREKYVSSALLVEKKVKPATEMVSKIVNDLNLRISTDGVLAAPDYGTSGKGVTIGKGAKILVPTHRTVEGDLLERVCKKYDSILEGLKNFEE
ncbi:Segregation and condensation protein B [Methanosarcina siciliae C2J]|uniref:Segregation and condensation protein B n=1 Tax=Methanosarcina siciliae C2J TaxID=1434118 RepID=A0A0E3PTJ9_9EURY|nr:SMC-Scp complex subunit ScpB [Methanosarcina siciliae]AKB38617.1 Segregation and condensation protein B [Methanosarcina siciliae C2J]